MPLGNLTSQFFANIYLNELDHFVKHKLKAKYYIRYVDDFVIVHNSKSQLKIWKNEIEEFLKAKLKLELHPNKVSIKTLASGIDFLGWVNFPDYRILRNTTKNRILNKIKEAYNPRTLASYFGLLRHGNTEKIKSKVLNLYIRNYK